MKLSSLAQCRLALAWILGGVYAILMFAANVTTGGHSHIPSSLEMAGKIVLLIGFVMMCIILPLEHRKANFSTMWETFKQTEMALVVPYMLVVFALGILDYHLGMSYIMMLVLAVVVGVYLWALLFAGYVLGRFSGS